MAMPTISIPNIALPFHIPTEIHPCVVHLAIALPLVILLLELVNLIVKKRTLGVFSFSLMVLSALILFGAYLTGTVDAKAAADTLSSGAVHDLFEEHKLQGIYLVYSSLILVVIKLLSVLIRKIAMRVTFLIFLLVFIALTLNTAKKGHDLVFDYGVNVSLNKAKSSNSSPHKEPTPSSTAQKDKAKESKKSKIDKAPQESHKPKEADKAEAKKKPTTSNKPKAASEPKKKPQNHNSQEPSSNKAQSMATQEHQNLKDAQATKAKSQAPSSKAKEEPSNSKASKSPSEELKVSKEKAQAPKPAHEMESSAKKSDEGRHDQAH